jgi:hypothetical protein
MLETLKPPVLLRAMAHVPLPRVALTLMVSEDITTPPAEAEDVDVVEVVPLIELVT